MIAAVLAEQQHTPITVTELTARIKQMLEIGFAKVEVSGEISRLTRPSSGHLYFTIKDAHASISAVIWRSTAARLKNIVQEGGEFIFTGHISLYEPRGTYQLIISRVETAGAGKLAAEFERRKQLYADLGYFDASRKQDIPALPKHIGIVTSPTAAAFEDVKKVLATRPAWLELTLSPALVQGSSAPTAISTALKKISSMETPPQVILLIRGGGSMEDLWCFNDEAVVKAIVDCPIPVITGVGHEIDTTLADLAADLRAATPSNAAELCCPPRDELRQRLPRISSLYGLLNQRLSQKNRDQRMLQQRQNQAWQRGTDARHHSSVQLSSRLSHAFHRHLNQAATPLRLLEKRLVPLQPIQRLQQQRLLLNQQFSGLSQQTHTALQQRQITVNAATLGLKEQKKQVQMKRQRLAVLCGELKELDPSRVLDRGYNMSFSADGRVITQASELQAGDSMQVRFRDGSVQSKVISTTRNPK
ncbi:exodeoxyribonuclease VII large subunit [Mariprofundus sp. EBB-1]|uniref:exodeoxyribonuclease VII large subunit n=1 Tax=Mariprofundus sp. EBB-1 TaxID=2650971 RepID=UPI000EF21E4E|nr:exodeoxyribonuclease VII large subunit [Mariprofundus sp. EBB-1]RLL50567.1 exodeoxyribonuclease VII large subunit [Mariprofundus sp. EBB-1]